MDGFSVWVASRDAVVCRESSEKGGALLSQPAEDLERGFVV
jgi:hypothetical protein